MLKSARGSGSQYEMEHTNGGMRSAIRSGGDASRPPVAARSPCGAPEAGGQTELRAMDAGHAASWPVRIALSRLLLLRFVSYWQPLYRALACTLFVRASGFAFFNR